MKAIESFANSSYGVHSVTGLEVKSNYKPRCPMLLLLAIMIFSQNVGAFSGLAVGGFSVIRNIVQLAILAFLLLKTVNRGRVYRDAALYYVVYLCCIGITMVLHMDRTGIFWILDLTIAFLFVGCYDIKDVLLKFIKAMFYICVVELIGYGILRVWLNFANTGVYQTIASLGIIHDHSSMLPYYAAGIVAPRAYAFYREPGVYQMFIIAALVLEFTLYEKVKKSHLIVFALTVLATYSKTGYISMVAVLLGGAIIIWHKDRKLKHLYMLGTLAVIPLVPRFLNVIISAFTATGTDAHSWMSRLASLFVNIYLYLQNPLTGISVGGVFENFAKVTKDIFGITAGVYEITDNTNTVLLNFAAFGTVVGVIFLVAQWRCIKSLTGNKWARLMFFMALIFLYAGEAVNATTFPYIICFIGASATCRRRLKEATCTIKTNESEMLQNRVHEMGYKSNEIQPVTVP